MFVCICNAIRETELRQAARECRGDAEEVYRCLGKEPQCGMCLDEAEAILVDARDPAKQLQFV
ncbi:MAG: bacterioferritin-associated ferredoxin [Novosphingobium sp.]